MNFKNKDIAKKNYDRKLWTKGMLKALVKKGRLTSEEYEEITAEPYSEENEAITGDNHAEE